MPSILYSFFIAALSRFIYLASLFNNKARKRKEGENHWNSLAKNNEQLAWFHCASLGEFEQGRPVLETFKKEFPAYKILLTFFSPSGYEVRKEYPKADFVTYLPLDSKSNARAFVDHFQPSIAFFVKYEFWRNFALELQNRNIPLISFSTIFRPSQVYFQAWGKPFRATLHAFSYFFVQNRESGALLSSIALENYNVSGDTRYDRVMFTKKSSKTIPKLDDFQNGLDTIVVGSAWAEDMELLIPLINDEHFANKQFIIAPHDINHKEIEKWSKEIKQEVQLFSTFDRSKKSNILFIDNVGMLSMIYQYANLAYIGGAFGKGLHNILEAAVFEIPVLFGNKNFKKFQEANDLIALETAFPIESKENLKETLLKLENEEVRSAIRFKNVKFIQEQLGASDKIIDYCQRILKNES